MRATRKQETDGKQPRSRRGSHARDLRFAGAVSAGLIAAILACGALLAPVTSNFSTAPSLAPGDDDAVVQLAPPAPGSQSSRSGARERAAAAPWGRRWHWAARSPAPAPAARSAARLCLACPARRPAAGSSRLRRRRRRRRGDRRRQQRGGRRERRRGRRPGRRRRPVRQGLQRGRHPGPLVGRLRARPPDSGRRRLGRRRHPQQPRVPARHAADERRTPTPTASTTVTTTATATACATGSRRAPACGSTMPTPTTTA